MEGGLVFEDDITPGKIMEPFSSCFCFTDLKIMDGLGKLSGALAGRLFQRAARVADLPGDSGGADERNWPAFPAARAHRAFAGVCVPRPGRR
jgi:hypothetical protein